MMVPLLATKFSLPVRRACQVPRPRLVERLDEGLRLGRRLTLVSAPVGCGKTTLLAEWISEKVNVAWLSLDQGDNDPALFFMYLVAALQRAEGDIGVTLHSLMGAPQLPPVEALVTSLINDIASVPNSFILILDDYHLIQTESIHAALAFLIDHQPSNLHSVILSREDPPLALSRLRARGELTEIREQDLRFSVGEAASFINQTMGLSLSDEMIATLEDRTEGWIAGLQLAGLSLQNRKDPEDFISAFKGEDRYIMDYLVEEVLSRQPQPIQDFLLQTSILERLSAPLCDAVLSPGSGEHGGMRDYPFSLASPPTDSPAGDSQHILEYLDHTNLFLVPLDNRREWYRYHHLFADLLCYRLKRAAPDQLLELHRRASGWYAQAGEIDAAMRHALTAPDYPLAAELAEQYAMRLIGGSRVATFLSWISQIPDEVICSHAYLCAGCGWAFVLSGQVEAAEGYVQAAEAILPAFESLYLATEECTISREEVYGHLIAIQAYCDRVRGDFSRAIEHSQQALVVLPPQAFSVRCVLALNLGLLHLQNGDLNLAQEALSQAFLMAQRSEENIYVAVSALSLQGEIAEKRGGLDEAVGYYQRAIQLATHEADPHRPVPAIGMAYGRLSAVYALRDEKATALHYLEKALALVEQIGSPEMLAYAYLFKAQIASESGNFTEGGKLIGLASDVMQSFEAGDELKTTWVVARGELHLLQGEIGLAGEWLQSQAVLVADLEGVEPRTTAQAFSLGRGLPKYLLLGRVLLAQGEIDRAAGLLDQIRALAETGGGVDVLIEAVALQSIGAHLQGNDTLALRNLEHALVLAAPQGYVRPFLNAGGRLIKILRKVIALDVQTAYAQKLLGHFAALPASLRIEVQPGPFRSGRHVPAESIRSEAGETLDLIEPLTERERQILRLLAVGLSSTEVAEELVIAVSTARSYIKSLYRKLDAHSREEAIDTGYKLGLI